MNLPRGAWLARFCRLGDSSQQLDSSSHVGKPVRPLPIGIDLLEVSVVCGIVFVGKCKKKSCYTLKLNFDHCKT